MPLSPAALAVTAAGFAVLGALAAFAHQQLLFFDDPIRDAVRSVEIDGYGTFLEWLGRLGSRLVTVPLTLVAVGVTWRRCRQLAVLFGIALVVAVGLEVVLKALVDRPRPVPDAGFGPSFPSGHVIAAAALWGLVPTALHVRTGKRWVWGLSLAVAVAIVVGVGLSRIYLSAHWPSDVLGALLLVVVFLAVAESAVRRPWRLIHCEACLIHRASPQ